MDSKTIDLIIFLSVLAAPIILLATYMTFITDWGVYQVFPYMFAAYLVYSGFITFMCLLTVWR